MIGGEKVFALDPVQIMLSPTTRLCVQLAVRSRILFEVRIGLPIASNPRGVDPGSLFGLDFEAERDAPAGKATRVEVADELGAAVEMHQAYGDR